MVFLRSNLSRRDAVLVLFGACFMHISSFLFPSQQVTGQSIATVVINKPALAASVAPHANAHTETQTPTGIASEQIAAAYPSSPTHIPQSDALLPTTVLAHAPGWTLFQNLYMSNGTLFLIIHNSSYTPSTSDTYGTTKVDGLFPEIRMMTSTGLMALNTPDNIAQREPTEWEMRFLSVLEAAGMWGKEGEEKRVWTVDGNTRDDPGFNSYFLQAAFPSLTVEHQEDWDDRVTSASIESPFTSKARAWHFPLALLADRSAAHRGVMCGSRTQRTAAEAWDYMRVRGTLRGIQVGGWWNPVREAIWRFAGVKLGNLSVVLPLNEGNGMEVVKGSQMGDHARFVGAEAENEKMLPMPEKSAHKRRLLKEDHEALVKELKALVARKNAEREAGGGEKELVKGGGVDRKWAPLASASTSSQQQPEWKLQVLEAEHMTKDEQVRAASRTTILLGVHGNGLTHLVFMPPTRISAVIEIFCPPGFAHDYQWTTRALGMTYFGVWNDTYFTREPERSGRLPFVYHVLWMASLSLLTIMEKVAPNLRNCSIISIEKPPTLHDSFSTIGIGRL
ncbi:uncharacterized protein LACBIDRAFT_333819 [Laccaria bicolor S238N-H82]|uniref:Predicted protein n=1 Tax=Laccaria bicolor (strain S238N-H82 / ATCC MYA-4686) TaxID=486041 RepID=B0DX64_LACBS|nr:uncharacterized protein LACBIDRAFT_333819 [Laccaria bicolor S238N-H82]EDR00740.1 predicted protein [Laccaria bicolor S238N-H82]|eukprot:XP_001888532.1 predicted protein [Laccaria bicolor S238N-H82]